MEWILDKESRFLTELAPAPRASHSPARVDRNSNVQCYHCQDWRHFATRCPKRSTAPEDNKIEASKHSQLIRWSCREQNDMNPLTVQVSRMLVAFLRPTVYVDAKLNGKIYRALLDTGSNVNIISEQTYKFYSPPMLLSDFHDKVLSATNNSFRIRGKFAGILAFGPGMVVQTEFFCHPGHRRTVDLRDTYIAGRSNVDRLSTTATNDGHRKQYRQFDISLENRKTRTSQGVRRWERVSIPRTWRNKNKQLSQACIRGRGGTNLQPGEIRLDRPRIEFKIMSTVASFQDDFDLNDAELVQTHLVEHEIDTGDVGLNKFSPHRLEPGKTAVLKEEVEICSPGIPSGHLKARKVRQLNS